MAVDQLVDIINSLLPEPHASLLAGMLFGVRRTMPPTFYDALIATGTLHIIALSGFNVSIIIRLFFDAAGALLGRIIGVLATLIGIIGFVSLVGPSPTVVRASIMGALTVLAVLVGRKDIPLLSLVIAVSIMIIIDPGTVKNISFQLSALATLGIILFAGQSGISLRLEKQGKTKPGEQTYINQHSDEKPGVKSIGQYKHTRLANNSIKHLLLTNPITSGVTSFIKDDLRVTLSAQSFTFPLILYYFHRISLVSPIANVFVGWLVAPITYLGFFMLFAFAIWEHLGKLASLVIWVPLTLFIKIVESFARIPYASISF